MESFPRPTVRGGLAFLLVLILGIFAADASFIDGVLGCDDCSMLWCQCDDGYVSMCQVTHKKTCLHRGVVAGIAIAALVLVIALVTCCCCCGCCGCCSCCRRQPRSTVVIASPPVTVLTVTSGGNPYARMQEDPDPYPYMGAK